MTKALQINKSVEKGIRELLTYLLETNKVSGVFTLKKINKTGSVSYSLITKTDEMKNAVPFYPFMPVNAGKILSTFTLRGATPEPVVAILKPCELRAFIELVKREQGSLENIIIMSATCGGVFPLDMAANKSIEKNLSNYEETIKKAEIIDKVRSICKGCEEFIPYTADMTVSIAAEKNSDKECVILLNTKKAETLVEGIKGDFIDTELDRKALDILRGKRETEKKKLYKEIEGRINGIDGLIDIFGRCIGCHGCREACPICYCKLCEFDSPDCEFKPSNYETELRKRGGLRVPPGIIYYQLGRLDHVTISCAGCGSCEDVCPVNIPLSIIFKKIGESVQKMFDYIPGRDVKELLPLATFEKEELTEFEE